MEKFKVGDRVKVKSNANTINRRIVGKIGTIKGFVCGKYAVEFDKKVSTVSCGGLTKDGFGWVCAEEILSIVKNETIVIYRNDQKVIALDKTTGKKAEAKCNPADEFDFNVGAKLAFQRLIGEKPAANCAVREVKRNAEIGEYIKIVNSYDVALGKDGKPFYKKDDVFKVIGLIGIFKSPKIAEGYDKNGNIYFVDHSEYVVLENYEPKKEPEKKDEICVGDTVKVVNIGRQFPEYEKWSGLEGYRQNFVDGSYVNTEDNYKFLVIKKHDVGNKTLALIQNPKTTQVFIINVDGLKKVER